jgi:hypothetical protein
LRAHRSTSSSGNHRGQTHSSELHSFDHWRHTDPLQVQAIIIEGKHIHLSFVAAVIEGTQIHFKFKQPPSRANTFTWAS